MNDEGGKRCLINLGRYYAISSPLVSLCTCLRLTGTMGALNQEKDEQ
jgi:hypothetical protein